MEYFNPQLSDRDALILFKYHLKNGNKDVLYKALFDANLEQHSANMYRGADECHNNPTDPFALDEGRGMIIKFIDPNDPAKTKNICMTTSDFKKQVVETLYKDGYYSKTRYGMRKFRLAKIDDFYVYNGIYELDNFLGGEYIAYPAYMDTVTSKVSNIGLKTIYHIVPTHETAIKNFREDTNYFYPLREGQYPKLMNHKWDNIGITALNLNSITDYSRTDLLESALEDHYTQHGTDIDNLLDEIAIYDKCTTAIITYHWAIDKGYDKTKIQEWFDKLPDCGKENDPKPQEEDDLENTNEQEPIKKCTKINPHYMNKQTEITSKNRIKVIDWLLEFSDRSTEISEEVVHSAVNIIDKFASCENIPLKDHQLVALASLLIAVKLADDKAEFIVFDTIQNYSKIFTKKQILDMERKILKTIDYTYNDKELVYFYLAQEGEPTECEKDLSRKILKCYDMLRYSSQNIAKAIKHICKTSNRKQRLSDNVKKIVGKISDL